MTSENEQSKTNRLIFVEWITTISVFIICFCFLANKIEKQSDRTDKLYEMFIELLKEQK